MTATTLAATTPTSTTLRRRLGFMQTSNPPAYHD
jgi:hypothetical protein